MAVKNIHGVEAKLYNIDIKFQKFISKIVLEKVIESC